MEQFLRSVPEWQSREKIASLCSAFKDKQLNPEDYEYKLSFWKRIINEAMELGLLRDDSGESSMFSTCISTLKSKFCIDGTYPLGMANVLQELCKDRVFEPRSEFFKRPMHVSNSTSSLLLTPFYKLAAFAASSFGWRETNGLCTSDSDDTEQQLQEKESILFVNVELLKSCGQKLQKSVELINLSPSDAVYTEKQFAAFASEQLACENAHDLHYLTWIMKRERMLIEVELEGGKVFCFLFGNGTTTTSTQKTAFTDSLALAKAVGQIKLTLERLSSQLNRLEEAYSLSSARLNEFIRQNNKNAALFQLKRTKTMEKSLEKSRNSMLQLEQVLYSIDESQTTAQTCAALSIGVEKAKEMLQATTSLPLLVQQFDELREEREEMDSVLSSALSTDEAGLEEAVEEEYQALVAQAQQQKSHDSLLQRIENLQITEIPLQEEPTKSMEIA